jgi:organic hydroperoxide reductase OsmC/OhrA
MVSTVSEELHEYTARVDWTQGSEGIMLVEGKPLVEVAAPPEFDGPEGILSPEDLFVASAASCFMTTFVTFSKKIRFEYKSFSCVAKGTLERVEKGFEFTRIHISATVSVGSDDIKPKAERALELAAKYCLVSNSMKCPTEHVNEIVIIK